MIQTKKTKISNNNSSDVFEHGIYKYSKLSAKGLPFASLYVNNKTWVRYMVVGLVGMFVAILTLFLIKNTGIYSYGFGGFFQGLARFTYFVLIRGESLSPDVSNIIYNVMFWGSVLVFNIPLLIFAYYKIGKTFAFLTLTYLVTNTFSGMLFNLIPGVDSIFLFGDTTLVAGKPASQWILDLNAKNVNIIPFSIPKSLQQFSYPGENYVKTMFLIVYGLIFGFAVGLGYAVMYIVGGSTGGADIISVFFATKKNINLGVALSVLNMSLILIGSTIGNYVPAGMTVADCYSFSFFFSANLVSTMVSLVVFTFVFNTFFPKSKLVKVEVFSRKAREVNSYLLKKKYNHSLSISKLWSGYKQEHHESLSTICVSVELPLLLRLIRTVDKNSTIIISNVASFDGIFKTKQYGSY